MTLLDLVSIVSIFVVVLAAILFVVSSLKVRASMTCPLPLHNPLRQKDGTFKCSECPKTWDENPTAKVIYPKGKR
jgi:hypothetical protein